MKIMIIAKPGIGKTHFGLNAPHVKVLHVLTEKQGESTVGIVARNGGMHPESESVTIENLADLYAKMPIIAANCHKFHVVELDTADDVEESIGRSIAKEKGGRSIEEIDEFNRSRGTRDTMFQEVINFFRDLPVHVIVFVHLRDRVVESGKGKEKSTATYTEPRFAGKDAVPTTMQKFNAVGIMTKAHTPDGEKRMIRFRGPSTLSLKDLPYLDDVMPADLEKILKAHQDFYRDDKSQKDA